MKVIYTLTAAAVVTTLLGLALPSQAVAAKAEKANTRVERPKAEKPSKADKPCPKENTPQVPEPTTMAGLALGLGGLKMAKRLRNRKAQTVA